MESLQWDYGLSLEKRCHQELKEENLHSSIIEAEQEEMYWDVYLQSVIT